MAIEETGYPHIVLEHGVPVIAGAKTKVVQLIGLAQADGLGPHELCEQLPHLTLEQVESALAYYRDHREAIDRDMAEREARAERLREELGQSPIVAKLRARGLL